MRISDWSSDVCSSDLLAEHRGHVLAFDALPLIDLIKVEAEAVAPHVGVVTDHGVLGLEEGDQRRRILSQHPLHQFLINSDRSEEHTSELQSLMRISYAVYCLKKIKNTQE